MKVPPPWCTRKPGVFYLPEDINKMLKWANSRDPTDLDSRCYPHQHYPPEKIQTSSLQQKCRMPQLPALSENSNSIK